MKKDVLKELQSTLTKRKVNNEKNAVIAEVTKLLEYDQTRDTDILRSIGQSSTLVQSENEKGAIIELERNEKFYSGTIFTVDQIEKVAVKYRLKFLPSSLFTSYIDPLVALDVKELERTISASMDEDQAAKRNMSVQDYVTETGGSKYQLDATELKRKFYILAPSKCFKLEKKEAFTIKSPDPILFYNIDESHYRLIRKWGTDFTIFRRLKGIFFLNRRSIYWSLASTVTLIALSLSIAFSWFFMFLMVLAIICIPLVYAIDWDSDFFGKHFIRSRSRY